MDERTAGAVAPVAAGLSSTRLPRYLSALELHARLAEKLEMDDADGAALRLAATGFRTQLRTIEMVLSDAKDMATKLDSLSY